MTRPVTTFTIGYEGKEDYNEFQFARQVSAALQDRPSRDADHAEGSAGLPAAAGAPAGRADRRQRLHPAVFPREAREADAAPPSCRSAKAPTRTSSATGGASTTGRNTRRSTSRRGSRRRGGSACSPAPRRRTPGVSGEDLEIHQARRGGAGAVLGRRRVLVGRACAIALTPSARRSRKSIDCPVEGLLPRLAHTRSTATRWSTTTSAALDRTARRARSAAEDSLHGDEAAAARAPADARRQADDGARRSKRACRSSITTSSSSRRGCRASYKLQGRRRQARPEASRRAVSRRTTDSPPQAGIRRADGGVVSRRRLRRRCLAAFERSELAQGGLLRQRLLRRSAQRRRCSGRGGYSFQLWTDHERRAVARVLD